jgi:hypothetical protein
MRKFCLFLGLSGLFYQLGLGKVLFFEKAVADHISFGIALLIAALFVWNGELGRREIARNWIWQAFGVCGALLLFMPVYGFLTHLPLGMSALWEKTFWPRWLANFAVVILFLILAANLGPKLPDGKRPRGRGASR